MADGITKDESKAMCVADGTRRPSMRARTPTKLDAFAHVVPPITDRDRGAVLRFQGTKSDRRHHYHHLRPFTRFQPSRDPFRSASSPPVAPFPSACSPFPLGVEGIRNRGSGIGVDRESGSGSRSGIGGQEISQHVRVTARGSGIGDPESGVRKSGIRDPE